MCIRDRNGRICAEGLLVFGVGGMAIVYALAPVLDNFIRRQKLKAVSYTHLSSFWGSGEMGILDLMNLRRRSRENATA